MPASPRVVSIRRYPVKSMGGESLTTVAFDLRGIVGDRFYAVRDVDNRLASGKNTRRMVRRDSVVLYAARTEGALVSVVYCDVATTGDLSVGDAVVIDA